MSPARSTFFARLRTPLPPAALVGAVIVLAVVFLALLSLLWTPYDPLHADAPARLQGPSAAHLLGTDRYGRDVFSALMAGSRITIVVGLVAVSIGAGIGTPLGVWAGMQPGSPRDHLIMRIQDVLLAFPALLLAIITGALWGASTLSAMVAIGVAGIPGFARVARAGTLRVINRDFISSARVSGVGPIRLALFHVLPNITGMLIVQASVAFALAILAEAALSFLGLGTPPPEPSWGRMLQSAQASLATAPLLALWPGLAIALTVLGFNLLGDGLRDFFDPKSKERSA